MKLQNILNQLVEHVKPTLTNHTLVSIELFQDLSGCVRFDISYSIAFSQDENHSDISLERALEILTNYTLDEMLQLSEMDDPEFIVEED